MAETARGSCQSVRRKLEATPAHTPRGRCSEHTFSTTPIPGGAPIKDPSTRVPNFEDVVSAILGSPRGSSSSGRQLKFVSMPIGNSIGKPGAMAASYSYSYDSYGPEL